MQPLGLSYLWHSGTCVPSRQGCAAGWPEVRNACLELGTLTPQGKAERMGGRGPTSQGGAQPVPGPT